MKIAPNKQRAFTLVEIMVSAGLVSLVLIAVLATNLTGLKIAAMSQAQISASTDSHMAMDRLMQDVRGAYSLQVGTNNNGAFTAVPDNTTQAGTALKIYPTTNASDWICYYYVPSSNALFRSQDDLAAKTVVISITNSTAIFSLEDYLGSPITNSNPQIPAVVALNLNFVSTIKSLSTNLLSTNYYNVRTKLSPRRT